MMPQSHSKKAPWDLTQFSQSPSAVLLHFLESHRWSEISPLSKVISVLGKARGHRVPNPGCRGTESHGWLMFHQNSAPKFCIRHDAWMSMLSWWSFQLPVAHSWGLVNHLNSFHEGMFKLHTKFDADLLLYSVILNTMATQSTCSLNSVYRPHWLVQWSRHCSHTCIPVHSPWLPGYIDVMQTILITLTMAGLFLDTPRISLNEWWEQSNTWQ